MAPHSDDGGRPYFFREKGCFGCPYRPCGWFARFALVLPLAVLSLGARNLAQVPDPAAAVNNPAALQELRTQPAVSVKDFGAVGDGLADDTSAIMAGFEFIAAKRSCLFFPPGAYKTTKQVNWNHPQTLCILGAPEFASYIEYVGDAQIDSAVDDVNPHGGRGGSVYIRDFGFAANRNAKYAFHAVHIGSLSTMDTVAFAGGSDSSFEGDFWNGQGDLRNLYVVPAVFDPTHSGCVNGLTFAGAVDNGTAFPSGQFTLTQPTIEYCSNIGLNLREAAEIVINGAQISANHQQFYQNCDLSTCNAVGIVMNGALLENLRGDTPSQIYGTRNIFNGLLTQEVQIFGRGNTFNNSQLVAIVEGGAITAPLSIRVSGNIATIEAPNNYVPWQAGVFSGVSGAGLTKMNGTMFSVLPTGLSSNQFQVALDNGGQEVGPIRQSGARFTPPQGSAAPSKNVFHGNNLRIPGSANFGNATMGTSNEDWHRRAALDFNASPPSSYAAGAVQSGQVACIKSAGPPVVLGYCSSINATGACKCN